MQRAREAPMLAHNRLSIAAEDSIKWCSKLITTKPRRSCTRSTPDLTNFHNAAKRETKETPLDSTWVPIRPLDFGIKIRQRAPTPRRSTMDLRVVRCMATRRASPSPAWKDCPDMSRFQNCFHGKACYVRARAKCQKVNARHASTTRFIVDVFDLQASQTLGHMSALPSCKGNPICSQTGFMWVS